MDITMRGSGENRYKLQARNSPVLYMFLSLSAVRDKWVPATTARRVLGLRMEERPPDMEGICEYFE
jgi:hypothetical protein